MHSNSGPRKPGHRVEREFGLIVGGMFVVLAAWWMYRGKFGATAHGVMGVGIVLSVLALAFPRALVVPNRLWMALAEALSIVATRVILFVVFFLVITPVGVAKRLIGWDPLGRRAPTAQSYWRPYSARQRDRHHYEKMF